MFEHPGVFNGEHVVSTPEIGVVIKDSLSLDKILIGDRHESLSARGYDHDVYYGHAAYFPKTDAKPACVAANVLYMPSEKTGSGTIDRLVITKYLSALSLSQHFSVQKFEQKNGLGIAVRLQNEHATTAIVTHTINAVNNAEGQITVSADLLPEYDVPQRIAIVKQTMLIWGGVEYALRANNNHLNTPINIVLEPQPAESIGHFQSVIEEYATLCEQDASLPRLMLDYGDISALHEVYSLTNKDVSTLIGIVARKIQSAYQNITDFDPHIDLPDITLYSIVTQLEQSQQQR